MYTIHYIPCSIDQTLVATMYAQRNKSVIIAFPATFQVYAQPSVVGWRQILLRSMRKQTTRA